MNIPDFILDPLRSQKRCRPGKFSAKDELRLTARSRFKTRGLGHAGWTTWPWLLSVFFVNGLLGQIPLATVTNATPKEVLSLAITNKYGDVLTNLTVAKVLPDGLLLEHPAGSTRAKWPDLPPEIRERYKTQANEAARKELDAGLVARNFVQRSEQEKAAAQAREAEQIKERQARESAGQQMLIKGRVMQHIEAGILVSSVGGHSGVIEERPDSIVNPGSRTRRLVGGLPIYEGICLVKDWPRERAVADGEEVSINAIDAGAQYSYGTVAGSSRTVRVFKGLF